MIWIKKIVMVIVVAAAASAFTGYIIELLIDIGKPGVSVKVLGLSMAFPLVLVFFERKATLGSLAWRTAVFAILMTAAHLLW